MVDFSEVIKSDLIINGYQFSVAQKEMMKYLNQQQKIKLTEIIQNHFINKEKSYRLQQDIFDNQIPIDNYLFKDLCYCTYVYKEKEIMQEYYSGFDTIESLLELDELINNEYLNLYPELKKEVRDHLIWLLKLE